MTREPAPSSAGILWSGFRGRCPRCGRGNLFDGFLQIARACDTCGLNFSGHDSGDGPAVAVIFILGFASVGAALWLETAFQPPLWVHAAIWTPIILGGSIGLLRPLKGLTVALQYKFRAVDEAEKLGGH